MVYVVDFNLYWIKVLVMNIVLVCFHLMKLRIYAVEGIVNSIYWDWIL